MRESAAKPSSGPAIPSVTQLPLLPSPHTVTPVDLREWRQRWQQPSKGKSSLTLAHTAMQQKDRDLTEPNPSAATIGTGPTLDLSFAICLDLKSGMDPRGSDPLSSFLLHLLSLRPHLS